MRWDSRLLRLDKVLPGRQACKVCRRPHLRDLAQFVAWYHQTRADPRAHFCTCERCQCREFAETMHQWKTGMRLQEHGNA